MGVSLKKGQKVDLTKGKEGLTQIQVGLGWDKQQQKFKLFGGGKSEIDCDASVFMLNEQGKLTKEDNIVYFGRLNHPSGSVIHAGDNRTGAGEGDDETIYILLDKVPADVCKILFVVNIYECVSRKQHFGMINNAYIRLLDGKSSEELMRFNLTESYEGSTTLITGEVYRNENEWKFNAIGEGTADRSLTDIVGRLKAK